MEPIKLSMLESAIKHEVHLCDEDRARADALIKAIDALKPGTDQSEHKEIETRLAHGQFESVSDVDYGQAAYEAHEALPAVKQAHLDRGSKLTHWMGLKHWERTEWRTIAAAVANAVRFVKSTPAPIAEKTHASQDELVERLIRIHIEAANGPCTPTGHPGLREGIRAVLAELAEAPVDLPSGKDILNCYEDGLESEKFSVAMERVAAMIRQCIAPVLVAKDARSESLERDHSALYHENAALETQVAEQAKRIAELEKQVSDESAYDSDLTIENRKMQTQIEVLEKRIADMKTRIAELEKSVAEKEQTNVIIAESVHTASVTLEHYANRIAELETGFDYGILEATNNQRDLAEKRITELTAPVIVDGKTPGQVNHEARELWFARSAGRERTPQSSREQWDRDLKEMHEAMASAVLRAFGNEAEASLKRTKEAVGNVELHFIGVTSGARLDRTARDAIRDVRRIINAERAALPAVKPTEAAVSALQWVRRRLVSDGPISRVAAIEIVDDILAKLPPAQSPTSAVIVALKKARDRIEDDGRRIYEDDSNAISVIDTACAMIDSEIVGIAKPRLEELVK